MRRKYGRSEDSIRLLVLVFSAVGVCSDLANKATPAERRGRKATGPLLLRDVSRHEGPKTAELPVLGSDDTRDHGVRTRKVVRRRVLTRFEFTGTRLQSGHEISAKEA